MLKTRILTAVVLIPLVLLALFGLGTRGWGLVALAIVVIAAGEWAGLASFRPPFAILFVAAVLLIGATLLFAGVADFTDEKGWPDALLVSVCGTTTLFWLFIAPMWLYSGWRVTSAPVLALLGWLLLLATWVAVVQVRARGPWLLLALMAIVWIADTAAYFAGRRFGRHKLAPSISPGKTWEGVAGAMIAVAAYALVLLALAESGGLVHSVTPAAAAAWIVLALLLASLSIVGDLFESHLKRQRGVKDSGRLLPGHGGVLDRIDALIAAMPGAALVEHYLIR
ncbi:MAG TPA: phosphatidate cytidylyltransferase [Casimicrobiaceae bacterium]|nr:phosphatidate cytidylyltransferase [Casimicrobiaceae bacterium]